MNILYRDYMYESISNPIKGGVGDESEPDSKALAKGIKVEKEHVGDLENSKNLDIAADIARDHLKEFPTYYDELEKMENKLEKEARED